MRQISRHIAVALVAVIALSGCARWESKRWQDLMTQTQRQYEAGRYDEALESAEALIEMRPEDRDGWWMLGSAQQRKGDYKAASESIRKALELAPASSQPLLLQKLGQILAAMEDYDGAIANYRQAIELAPDLPGARGELGYALVQAGRLDEAAEVLEEAEDRAPDDASTWFALGFLRGHNGDYEEAVTAYRKALQREPDMLTAQRNLAFALLQLGSEDAAIEHLDVVLTTDTADQWALATVDAALRSVGRPQESLDYYRGAHEADPENWDRVGDLAERLVDAGFPEEALEVLDESADSLPEGWERYLAAKRALALVALGRVERAREELLNAPEPGGGVVPSYFWTAPAWAQVGDVDRAVTEAMTWSMSEPYEADAHFCYALTQALDGDMVEVRGAAERERDLLDEDEQARTVMPLALALASEGEDDAARKELLAYDHYLTKDLPPIEDLYLAGLAYRELGDTEKSDALFQIAIDRWPRHPWSVKMREMMR